jgi:hypothetical protein
MSDKEWLLAENNKLSDAEEELIELELFRVKVNNMLNEGLD